jgi:hypothetical protein
MKKIAAIVTIGWLHEMRMICFILGLKCNIWHKNWDFMIHDGDDGFGFGVIFISIFQKI